MNTKNYDIAKKICFKENYIKKNSIDNKKTGFFYFFIFYLFFIKKVIKNDFKEVPYIDCFRFIHYIIEYFKKY